MLMQSLKRQTFTAPISMSFAFRRNPFVKLEALPPCLYPFPQKNSYTCGKSLKLGAPDMLAFERVCSFSFS